MCPFLLCDLGSRNLSEPPLGVTEDTPLCCGATLHQPPAPGQPLCSPPSSQPQALPTWLTRAGLTGSLPNSSPRPSLTNSPAPVQGGRASCPGLMLLAPQSSAPSLGQPPTPWPVSLVSTADPSSAPNLASGLLRSHLDTHTPNLLPTAILPHPTDCHHSYTTDPSIQTHTPCPSIHYPFINPFFHSSTICPSVHPPIHPSTCPPT